MTAGVEPIFPVAESCLQKCSTWLGLADDLHQLQCLRGQNTWAQNVACMAQLPGTIVAAHVTKKRCMHGCCMHDQPEAHLALMLPSHI